MENEKESAATTISFLRLSGLRPGTAIHIRLGNAEEVPPPECKDEALELAKHPKVIAALTRLGGSEQKLHAEIRRQYPDLKLGPAYVNEEGLDRFGIVAGLTVPLWNRNRKNIAEAEADRDALHLAAINVWRTLVCDAAEARANLLRLLKHPPLPNNELEHADILSAAGELTPLEYIEVREEILNFELAHADWRREVALSSAELEKYNVK
jgi:outer membrane protein TolC